MKRISKHRIAEEYGYSTRTIERRVEEIEALVGKRYPARSVIREPHIRVREDVARDYLENRSLIIAGIAPAFIGR